ncbi:hypothetical protein D3C77_721840 [compost metagenome]
MPSHPAATETSSAIVNPLATRRASEAGRTISEETSRTPTIGIAAATVKPVNTAKENDSRFTCKPLICAVSSSKVIL